MNLRHQNYVKMFNFGATPQTSVSTTIISLEKLIITAKKITSICSVNEHIPHHYTQNTKGNNLTLNNKQIELVIKGKNKQTENENVCVMSSPWTFFLLCYVMSFAKSELEAKVTKALSFPFHTNSRRILFAMS